MGLLRQKLILFSFAGLLLSMKADGRFPLPATLSESKFQMFLLPYTALFICVIVFFFQNRKRFPLPSLSPVRLASWISIIFLTLVLFLFFLQEKKYSQFGYHLNRIVLTGFYIAGEVALVLIATRGSSPKRFLFICTLISGTFYALSILWFPLHAERSDMLPLIQAAGQRFLGGTPPYMVYSLPHLVPLTYLPGLWMAYLPAVLFHFDLRWIHLAATITSVWIVYASMRDDSREIVSCLSGIFLLIPYLIYRHEIYLGILWLALCVIHYFERKNRPLLVAVFTGIAAAMSQFVWVLAPFYFLGIYRRSGVRKTAAGLVLGGLAFVAFVLPFVIQAPVNFYDGVFGHWSHTFNATTLNLSYFVSLLLSPDSLKYFQLAAVSLAFFLARRSIPDRTYKWMTYALLFFILLNPLIWVYFYLTVLVMMILQAAQGAMELRPAP